MAINLKPGGIFSHIWRSEIVDYRENEYIDFREFRIELKAEAKGSKMSFIVFNINGQEWRGFWRTTYPKVYYAQFGGIDPYWAAFWHQLINRFSQAVIMDVPYFLDDEPVLNTLLMQHYGTYLRELHHHKLISNRPELTSDLVSTSQGYARCPQPMTEARRQQDFDLHMRAQGLTIETLTRPPQNALMIKGETTIAAFYPEVRRQLIALRESLEQANLPPQGPGFVRLIMASPTSVQYEAGFPVNEFINALGDAYGSKLPTKVLSTQMPGEYDQAVRIWDSLTQYANQKKLSLAAPHWAMGGGWHEFTTPAEDLTQANSTLYLELV